MIVSGTVFAHAELLNTTPDNGSVMASSPEEFVIRFSEPVSLIRTQLMNSNRELEELGQHSIIDNVLRFKTQTPLQEGQYLLSFRVLSLDAHPVSGSVGFAIGNLPAPLPEYTQVDETSLRIARVNRTIYLLAILTTIGLVIFPFLFTLPDELESKRQACLNLAAAICIATAISGMGLWGVLLTETSLSGFFDLENWSLAMSTSLGTSFYLVVCGVIGILTSYILGPNYLPGQFSGLLGVTLIVISLGASGHAASSGLIMNSLFVIHALMAGIWLGALWLLYRCIAINPVSMITVVLNQFSRRATIVVSILLLCALIMAWYQLGEIRQLIYSDYGYWLMIKLGLVALVLIIAAINRWRIAPTLESDATSARQSLRRSILIEGLLMIVVLAVTSVLASTPPPVKAVMASFQTAMLTSEDQINLKLSITPAQTGINNIDMVFTKNEIYINPLEVELFWQQQASGIELLSQTAENITEGTYRVENVNLLVAGNWLFRAEALIDDFTRERFETEFRIE
jgi:copper transport protein